MNNEVFQKVFDEIQSILPDNWMKMVLYAGYSTGSYSMKYYTCDDKGTYTSCFEQKNISRAELIKIFMGIDNILTSERKKLEEKDKWSVMTLMVDADGTMKAEFDYSDISENTIEYEKAWKKRYIK